MTLEQAQKHLEKLNKSYPKYTMRINYHYDQECYAVKVVYNNRIERMHIEMGIVEEDFNIEFFTSVVHNMCSTIDEHPITKRIIWEDQLKDLLTE